VTNAEAAGWCRKGAEVVREAAISRYPTEELAKGLLAVAQQLEAVAATDADPQE
jgi:hypothetical protein